MGGICTIEAPERSTSGDITKVSAGAVSFSDSYTKMGSSCICLARLSPSLRVGAGERKGACSFLVGRFFESELPAVDNTHMYSVDWWRHPRSRSRVSVNFNISKSELAVSRSVIGITGMYWCVLSFYRTTPAHKHRSW